MKTLIVGEAPHNSRVELSLLSSIPLSKFDELFDLLDGNKPNLVSQVLSREKVIILGAYTARILGLENVPHLAFYPSPWSENTQIATCPNPLRTWIWWSVASNRRNAIKFWQGVTNETRLDQNLHR